MTQTYALDHDMPCFGILNLNAEIGPKDSFEKASICNISLSHCKYTRSTTDDTS